MNALTDIQFINGKNGTPEYAVIPYKMYKEIVIGSNSAAERKAVSIPHEVVGKITIEGYSAVQAWREYLGLTQSEVASKMEITQAAYSQMETAKKIRRPTIAKIAAAFGISVEQLQI